MIRCRRAAHLWCLRLDLAGTGEGSVNFTHDCGLTLLIDGIDGLCCEDDEGD